MKRLMQIIALVLLLPHAAAGAGETTQNAIAPQFREGIWAIPSAVPMLAYTVRPIGEGPFRFWVMNHGVSLDAKERSYFPVIAFRDAALWFARRDTSSSRLRVRDTAGRKLGTAYGRKEQKIGLRI